MCQASVAWLEAAERRLSSLATTSDNVRAVRIQLEQLKVSFPATLCLFHCHISVAEDNIAHLLGRLPRTSPPRYYYLNVKKLTSLLLTLTLSCYH